MILTMVQRRSLLHGTQTRLSSPNTITPLLKTRKKILEAYEYSLNSTFLMFILPFYYFILSAPNLSYSEVPFDPNFYYLFYDFLTCRLKIFEPAFFFSNLV